MISQLISAREYPKPVRFFASVDARKRLKPASTEDGYKPFCSVDRPLETLEPAGPVELEDVEPRITQDIPVHIYI